jgi:hypothetical protein
MSTHNYNSLTLQVLHINLLFTEAVFSTYADNSYLTAHTLLVLHFTTRLLLAVNIPRAALYSLGADSTENSVVLLVSADRTENVTQLLLLCGD